MALNQCISRNSVADRIARFLLALCLVGSAPLFAQTPETRALDTSSPDRAIDQFFTLYAAERFEEAAGLLNLDYLGAYRKRTEGPELAQRLGFVLSQRVLFDPDIPGPGSQSTEESAPGGDPDRLVVGRIPLGPGEAAIVMERRTLRGRVAWRFASDTVRLIPALYKEHGPGTLAKLLPRKYSRQSLLGLEVWQWIGLPAVLAINLLFSFLFIRIGEGITHRFVDRTSFQWDNDLFDVVRLPIRTLASLALLLVLVRLLRLPGYLGGAIDTVLKVMLVGAGVWLLLRSANFILHTLQDQLTRGITDEKRVRGVRTQIIVLRRVAFFLVVLVGVALALTQFKALRTLGVSLLASAGVAGVMLSFAAQKSLASLLAGIQLALTQPLRIGDKILINGEVGWVDQINLTYLVIRIWDLRRLVVPITQVLDQPFQNWSLADQEMMGDVTLRVDYGAPVENLREATGRLVEADPNWNGNFWNLQVTDASEQTLTIRALMTAHPDKLWDLRCNVREGLLKHLRDLDDGRYLPRVRIEKE